MWSWLSFVSSLYDLVRFVALVLYSLYSLLRGCDRYGHLLFSLNLKVIVYSRRKLVDRSNWFGCCVVKVLPYEHDQM